MYRTNSINTGVFLGSLLITGFLVLLAYGITQWLGMDPGNLRNWVVGLLVLWWLVTIVTLPWDLYFKARALLLDTQHSHKEGMSIAESDVVYVKRWAKLSFIIAIALHLVSAVGLALLEVYGVSELGYFASAAAILLMGLRPALRAYDYLVARLSNIGRDIRYPRDDVLAVKNQAEVLREQLDKVLKVLDLDNNSSWASTLETRIKTQTTEQEKLRHELEELRRTNDESHRQLAHEAEVAASKIAGGAKVIGHVRELVRFFKDA